MEYDARTRSTLPFCRKGSRLSDMVSTHFTLSLAGSMPSPAASILAISTSKPVGTSDAASLKPSPGWSNFTPMVISPLSASSFMWLPAGRDAAASLSASTFLPLSSLPALPPHAVVTASIRPTTTAVLSMSVASLLLFPGRFPRPLSSARVLEDQCLRILPRKSLARSDFGLVKNSSGVFSSTIAPSDMNTTRSAAVRAKPISWVTTIIVIPR